MKFIDILTIYIFVTLAISILLNKEDFAETKVIIDGIVMVVLLIASCTLWLVGFS